MALKMTGDRRENRERQKERVKLNLCIKIFCSKSKGSTVAGELIANMLGSQDMPVLPSTFSVPYSLFHLDILLL